MRSLLLGLACWPLLLADPYADRVATVTSIPGLVAFWDFTKREAPGARGHAHRHPDDPAGDRPAQNASVPSAGRQ